MTEESKKRAAAKSGERLDKTEEKKMESEAGKTEEKKMEGEADKSVKKRVWEEISKVEDPEIGIGIVDLGLIYDLQMKAPQQATIIMTLTSMGCPFGPQLRAEVYEAARRIVSQVEVEVVFSPPWDPHEMASEEAKMYLGIM